MSAEERYREKYKNYTIKILYDDVYPNVLEFWLACGERVVVGGARLKTVGVPVILNECRHLVNNQIDIEKARLRDVIKVIEAERDII